MDSYAEDNTVAKEISSPKIKGMSLPIEHHYFRFERQKNMLSDEDQTLVDKDLRRIRERDRQQNMTDEERVLERERRRLRDEQRRKNMSDEQRSLEKERRRIRERERRNNMSEEQRAAEMERRRIRERQHRQNMDDEQRSRDRERRRQRDKQRREGMNDEQRDQERERRRLYEQQKRGTQVNKQLQARRNRRALAAKQLLVTQNEQISGAEQDNQNASYSTDVTSGSQTVTLRQDNLQVKMINSSECSWTTTLNHNESSIAVYNGNHVVGGHNTSDGIEANALTQNNLKLGETDSSKHSSTSTRHLDEGTVVVYDGDNVANNQNALFYSGATDENQILGPKDDNQRVEVTVMSNLTTNLDLNESRMGMKL